MKNKRFTITSSDLNLGTAIKLTVPMTVSTAAISGEVKTVVLYPIEIQSFNLTEADLEFNTFANEEEYQDYVKNPSYYAFITFKNGTVLTDDNHNFLHSIYFIIRKKSGIATSDLEIEFINYR